MKKGITLTAIIAVIIVLSILASTVSITAVNIINNINKTKLAMEFLMVKEAYDAADLTDTTNSIYGEYIKMDLSGLLNTEKDKYFSGEDYSNFQLRILNLNALEIEGLSRGYGKKGTTDFFAISEKTNIIYYVAGEKIGKNLYYAYTEDLQKAVSEQIYNIGTLHNGIIVEYDREARTEIQEIIIKIPSSHEDIKITTSNGASVEKLNDIADNDKSKIPFYLYSVNKDKAVAESYVIEILTTFRDYEFMQAITIPAPYVHKTITIKDGFQQIFRYDKSENTLDAYITGFKFDNYEDEIVKLKYDNFDVSTLSTDYKKYFESNGINLKNDKLPINKGVSTVFIYAEDKYGNIGTRKINIDSEIKDGFFAVDGAKFANPPIPEGFEVVSASSYTKWNGEFVIEDKYGSQYVWVPVGANITANGKIYDISERYGRRTSKYNNNVLQDTNFNSFIANESENQYTSLGAITYDQTYQSVKKYEGFYISRYELAKDSANNRLVSRKNMNSLEETVSYFKTRLVELGEAYPKTSEKTDPIFATAILPRAEHYDTLFQFLIESGRHSSTVVHLNSSSVGSYLTLDNQLNIQVGNTFIQDLAGGLGEWTLEKVGTNYVYRSGKADPEEQAMSARTSSSGKAGARIVLYLTENP